MPNAGPLRISIVTIVLNDARGIERTLRSVQAQNYQSLEHVIIDGASTDGTLEVIEQYRDGRTIVISEKDRGIYDAMNKGLKAASGDVIGFLNADDTLASPDTIAAVASHLAQTRADGIYSDVLYIDARGKLCRWYLSRSFRPWQLAFGHMPSHPGIYLRREVYERVRGFDDSYRIAGDFDLFMRSCRLEGIEILHLPKVVAVMRAGGVSSRGLSSNITINREIRDSCRRNGVYTNAAMLWSRYLLKIFQFLPRCQPSLNKIFMDYIDGRLDHL